MMRNSVVLGVFCLILIIGFTWTKKSPEGQKPKWAEKDIRDYNDADLERLLDQWEEDEEPLEPDELPEHLRKPPPMDFANVDPTNPESLLQMSKKGKTLMAFVTVSGKPTANELEERTKLWQTGLMNSHIQCDRFVIDENRAIFMFKDGSQAWEAKDYLITQELCEDVVIENKSYPGIYKSQAKQDNKKSTATKDEF